MSEPNGNPLGTQPITRLLLKYAVPSIISMLVMSLYNIVDQIFIGRGVGPLGNGATTVAFPLVTLMLALSLLVGNGSAAAISLALGRGEDGKAKTILGNAVLLILVLSALLMCFSLAFLEPLLRMLGSTENILPYAKEYTSIILLGAPFAMISSGLANVMRADGSPRFSMVATLSGAVLNTILDPIFIFAFDMGVAGAAWATIIGQFVSACIVAYYLVRRGHYVRLSPSAMRPRPQVIARTCALGSSSFVTQMAIALINVLLNLSLRHYGQGTSYGADIAISAMGVVTKINAILLAVILGVAIGAQPILGFNYSAGNYGRVRQTYRREISITFIASSIMCLLFISFPHVFISIFGDSNADFSEFAARVLRIYLCCVFTAGIQIPSANYFQAVGKPLKAMLLSMTRQVFLLAPLILVLPLFFGIDGILFSAPVADVASCAITSLFLRREMRILKQTEERDLPVQQTLKERPANG